MPPFTTPRAEARRHQQLQQRQRSRAPWLAGWNRQCLAAINLDVAWARFVKAVGRRLESPNRPAKSGYYAGCNGCLAGVALVCALLVVLPLILQRRAFLSSSALRAASSIDREALAVAVERRGPYIDSADISAASAWPSALDDLPPPRDDSVRGTVARARGDGGAGGEGVTGGNGEGETREGGLREGELQGEGERRSGGEAEGGAEAACASGGAGCPYPDIVVRAKGRALPGERMWACEAGEGVRRVGLTARVAVVACSSVRAHDIPRHCTLHRSALAFPGSALLCRPQALLLSCTLLFFFASPALPTHYPPSTLPPSFHSPFPLAPSPGTAWRRCGPLHARMEAVCAGYAITQLLPFSLLSTFPNAPRLSPLSSSPGPPACAHGGGGPLHARMEAVCAGYAITQLLAMKLSPPVVDAVGVPHPHGPHAAAAGAAAAAGMDAAAAAAAGSSGGSSSSGGAEGPGVGEEGVRQLRLAVLWQPDSGVWDAHFHHLFLPLPLSPSLPDDHDAPHNGSHNDPRAAGAATVAVLHEKPLWLHSPLYAEGPQPQHNPHGAQQAPWLVEQPPVPFPTHPHTTRRRLLGTGANRVSSSTGTGSGRARSSQQLRSGRLASARLLLSPPGSSSPGAEPDTQSSGGQRNGGQSTDGQSTGRRRLAEAAGGNTGSSGSTGGSSSGGGGGGNTVSVSLHLLSSLRSAATSMEVAPGSEEAMELQASMVECYGMLHPSPAVHEIVAWENLTHVRHSTAVYMEIAATMQPLAFFLMLLPSHTLALQSSSALVARSDHPSVRPWQPVLSGCTGCDVKQVVNCTARRLMWLFLAHPATATTLAAFWPSHALAVAHTFHPARQPHLLRTTLHRSEQCRPNPQRGEMAAPPIVPHPWTPKQIAEKRHRADMAKNVSRADAAAADVAMSVASRKERKEWLDKAVQEQLQAEKRSARGTGEGGGEEGSGAGAGEEGAGGGEGGSVSLIAGVDGPEGAGEAGGMDAKGDARRERVLEFLQKMYGPGMGARQLGKTEGEQRRQIRAMLKELMGRDWKTVLAGEEEGEKEGEGDGEGEGEGEGQGKQNVFSLAKQEQQQGEAREQLRKQMALAEKEMAEREAKEREVVQREWEGLDAKQRSIRCSQLEAAELFALSHALRLVHLQHSPQADFLHAQAMARRAQEASQAAGGAVGRGERGGGGWVGAMAEGVERGEEVGLVREETVCQAPSTKPITKHRIGHQLIVDEGIGLLYCWVPKVACTSWKVWLRQQHHDRHSNDLLSTHRPFASNITELWYALSEPAAIRAVTRPDLLRFVFVRQPFERIVSAYLNKHVAGGGPDGWGRKFWNL
ncbi:unnamed protein product, partial [Closterium sp. Naga37s-1]